MSTQPSPSRESSEFEFVSGNDKDAPANTKAAGASEGLFGWVKGTSGDLFSKVAEKTKSSVESVIMVLDPQMKGQYTILRYNACSTEMTFQITYGRVEIYASLSRLIIMTR